MKKDSILNEYFNLVKESKKELKRITASRNSK